MSSLENTKVFNHKEAIIEGWYWLLQSREIAKNKVKSANLMGQELVVYRGQDNKIRVMDAYCPHMGAHLAQGNVEGNSLRCFFHFWKYSESGELIDIPCRKKLGLDISIKTYHAEEKYGLIWIWAGDQPKREIPYVPELKDQNVDFLLGTPFLKECHPNVMMINAIDAHHFYSVHNLPVKLNLEPNIIDSNTIQFNNTTKIPKSNFFLSFISKFYKKELTYSLCYHNATTGTVTLGPDFLHFHIMFAIRVNKDGQSEGQTVLLTKKRKGLFGKILNSILLRITRVVGNYFAKGDTEVFKTIKFSFKNPILEDAPIIKFIQHAEKQNLTTWGFSSKKETDLIKIPTSLKTEVKKEEVYVN